MVSVPTKLSDVSFADVVVVGRIANYHIVRDEEFRRRMLANPNLPADMRKMYTDKDGTLMSDYAQFDVIVSEVLRGTVPGSITVTWDNSTFGEPATLPGGSFLIALRKARSAQPPLRGPSATVLPDPDPRRLAVLQAPCAGPFMFESNSDAPQQIRGILEIPSK